ncbi:MAG: RsmB/NOP family class I SAM-dependent RNA methyltransferase [Sphingobacterium sp.]|uniref:RNA methyltransferase n=1 Tax=Sphingobacterium sp. JB170 TaxID=1434842 RepID=UPI00097E7FEF|nr:RNA methyltransferase [Sphingobacterium sp. JB170]SJN48647.1 Nol1/Nop2/Sun family protein [Sphingobacterium sp. JB170]
MSGITPRRVEQQVWNFQNALTAYSFDEPFSRFLTQFFKNNKQMGSSDRRMTSRLCYNYFRLGNALTNLGQLERLTIAEFLCEQHSEIVKLYQPNWVVNQSRTVEEKCTLLTSIYGSELLANVFPNINELSSGIDKDTFIRSHFVQPDLFIRIQRGMETFVENHLSQAGIAYKQERDQTYRLANGTKLQNVSVIEGVVQVQDFSSQESLNPAQISAGQSWWDACAASGGKSLLLLDKQPRVKLLVSDLRLSVLRNLDERFQKAGVQVNYRKKVIDLTANFAHVLQDESFDGVILDAPCTGSGTWGRTPEMIQQFSQESIAEFARLQKKIASNVVSYVKPGGQLIYITCSVFAKENEEVSKYIQEHYGLIYEDGGLIPGYHRGSDSMYSIRLRKPLK